MKILIALCLMLGMSAFAADSFKPGGIEQNRPKVLLQAPYSYRWVPGYWITENHTIQGIVYTWKVQWVPGRWEVASYYSYWG